MLPETLLEKEVAGWREGRGGLKGTVSCGNVRVDLWAVRGVLGVAVVMGVGWNEEHAAPETAPSSVRPAVPGEGVGRAWRLLWPGIVRAQGEVHQAGWVIGATRGSATQCQPE